MRLYRIAPKTFRDSVLSGHGSSTTDGARWNSPGVPVSYAASSASLAYLEVLAHLTSFNEFIKRQLYWFVFELDDDLVDSISPSELGEDWLSAEGEAATRASGTRFLEAGNRPALEVPSALVPIESNFVLNPLHKEIRKLEPVEEIRIQVDPRFHSLAM